MSDNIIAVLPGVDWSEAVRKNDGQDANLQAAVKLFITFTKAGRQQFAWR